MRPALRNFITIFFALLTGISVYYAFNLQFSFSLEQFFPKGDEDLEFYLEFQKEFGADVNFLLVALEREEGVFEQSFLEDAKAFTLEALRLPHVAESQSLVTMEKPIKTPFAITTVPLIHIDDPSRYEKDKQQTLNDKRFVNSFITSDACTMVVALKLKGTLDIEASDEMMTALKESVSKYSFDNHYFLGSAYFQNEMVDMQKREVVATSIFSGILVTFVMFWVFRRFWGMSIALLSIAMGLVLFFGFLGFTGRPLNAMAALYPLLMIIVGTSDVIHIMSKYIDELRKGNNQKESIRIAIKEIGLATLLTSVTTAIGFLTLATSRVDPIREFGINAAIGVGVAYITVILFTTACISFFPSEKLIRIGRTQKKWDSLMVATNEFTKKYHRSIIMGAVLTAVLCGIGIMNISTNYRIESNLPIGKKITEDFFFFEKNLTGFRPMDIAVFAQGDYKADDFEVLQQINKVEQHIERYTSIQSVTSITDVYKSINQMYGGNRAEAYLLPSEEGRYRKYKKLTNKVAKDLTASMISNDQKKARISTRLKDIGSDSIKVIESQISHWISQNTDSSIVTFKATGTGLILDKNAAYIRRNLLQGLGIAVFIISLLMAFLFKTWRMTLISLIPNIFPLLLAGAMLGYLGIELDAGISIIFAIIFGIAVDDTIHFLSKFKLSLNKGLSIEESLHTTFVETGKAICLTSLILFFGFLVLLTSIHPPSVTIGLLISMTLISAVVSDLLLIPVMIRWLMKDEKEAVKRPDKVVPKEILV